MNLGIGLGVTNYLRVPTAPLDPEQVIADLFDAGGGTFYEGAWYDPSDLSTMYQDAAGTTPVTASGQPVGLLLDKSKGGLSATELLSPTSASDWTVFGGNTISDDADGSVEITYVDTPDAAVLLLNNLYAGIKSSSTSHVLTFDAKVDSSSVSAVINGSAYSGSQSIGSTSYQTYSFTVRWNGASANMSLQINMGATDVVNIKNVSLKELPGNHATQSTSAARPVLQTSGGLWYLDFDGVDDRMVATFAATVNRPADIAIAWNRDATANGYIYSGATANGRLFLQTYNSPPRAIQAGNYDASSGAASNWEDSATSGIVDAVVTARFTATSPYRALRINGSLGSPIFLSGANGGNNWDGITLGSSHSSTAYSNFNCYGYVGINRTLTAGEISSLESYLATKSGVTL